jgi:hypothetical protein
MVGLGPRYAARALDDFRTLAAEDFVAKYAG